MECRTADARHWISGSVVGDRFRNHYIALVIIGIAVRTTAPIGYRQLRFIIRPFVIDGFTICVRHFNVVG